MIVLSMYFGWPCLDLWIRRDLARLRKGSLVNRYYIVEHYYCPHITLPYHCTRGTCHATLDFQSTVGPSVRRGHARLGLGLLVL